MTHNLRWKVNKLREKAINPRKHCRNIRRQSVFDRGPSKHDSLMFELEFGDHHYVWGVRWLLNVLHSFNISSQVNNIKQLPRSKRQHQPSRWNNNQTCRGWWTLNRTTVYHWAQNPFVQHAGKKQKRTSRENHVIGRKSKIMHTGIHAPMKKSTSAYFLHTWTHCLWLTAQNTTIFRGINLLSTMKRLI